MFALKQIMDCWLDYQRIQNNYPGIAVAIMHKGEFIYEGANGLADVEQNLPLTAEQQVRIASQSKVYTAVAIMLLLKRGMLQLEDKINKYLQVNPEDEILNQVTIRQLLMHVGGISRDTDQAEFWMGEESFPNREMLTNYLQSAQCVIENNTKFKYSNIGFGLLGLIVEQVSGRKYNDFVTDEIIKPCGLRATTSEIGDEVRSLVQGYGSLYPHNLRQKLNVAAQTHALAAATGFCGTVKDQCLFYHQVFGGDNPLLDKQSYNEMVRPGFAIDGRRGDSYGLGLCLYPDRLVGHGGSFIGHETKTLYKRDLDLVVSVAINAIDGNASNLAAGMLRLAEMFLENQSRINATVLGEYSGVYHNIWGTDIILANDNQLWKFDPSCSSLLPAAAKMEPIPEKTDCFKIVKCMGFGSFNQEVVFQRDETGTITAMKYAGTTANKLKF